MELSRRYRNIPFNTYKIKEILRTADAKNKMTKIGYTYDASGNRIGKMVDYSDNQRKYTWHVRDAQGNVMGIYNAEGQVNSGLQSPFLQLTERYIYGSSRLGVEYSGQNVDGGPWNAAEYYSDGLFMRGQRQYELTNHLGNVLVTISDKKIGIADPLNAALIKFFEPVMLSGTDYYPFGMPMRIGGNINPSNLTEIGLFLVAPPYVKVEWDGLSINEKFELINNSFSHYKINVPVPDDIDGYLKVRQETFQIKNLEEFYKQASMCHILLDMDKGEYEITPEIYLEESDSYYGIKKGIVTISMNSSPEKIIQSIEDVLESVKFLTIEYQNNNL